MRLALLPCLLVTLTACGQIGEEPTDSYIPVEEDCADEIDDDEDGDTDCEDSDCAGDEACGSVPL